MYDRMSACGHSFVHACVHAALIDAALTSVAAKIEQGSDPTTTPWLNIPAPTDDRASGRYATLGITVGQRAFVRLSTRSAKDCILKCPSIDFKQAMLDRLKKVSHNRRHPALPTSPCTSGARCKQE